MKKLFMTIIVLSSHLAFGSDDQVVVRTKYEKYRCYQASDAGTGKPLQWSTVDLSKCGFDVSKPFRKEMALIKNQCMETHIWDSSTGYGQYKEIVASSAGFMKDYKKCGYDVDHPKPEYKVKYNQCQKYEIIHSSFANMTDIPLIDVSRESFDSTNCGFKPENARTVNEIRNNDCYQLQVNFNSNGDRIITSSKPADLTSCGINLKSSPAAVIYSLAVQNGCTKVETFVSTTGLGTYLRYSKAEDASSCTSAVDGKSANAPGPAGATP
jgi:hypothetical protein